MSSNSKKFSLVQKILIGSAALFGVLMVGVIAIGAISVAREDKERKEVSARVRARALEKKAAAEAAFVAMTPSQHLDEAQKALDANQLDQVTRHLKAMPPNSPGVSTVHQRLASMQAKAKAAKIVKEKEREAILQKELVEARKKFAEKLEYKFLDKGLNMDVTAEGKNADILKLKWALTSKVAAHEISKGDLIETARSLGFKKVYLTNGFESSMGESYTWDLKN